MATSTTLTPCQLFVPPATIEFINASAPLPMAMTLHRCVAMTDIHHIAATNFGDVGFCGIALQTEWKILERFMRLDSYLRHWGPASPRHKSATPRFCYQCQVAADAGFSAAASE